MKLAVILKLIKIRAEKLTERVDDEIYIITTAQFAGSDNKIIERAPGEGQIWKFKQGQEQTFDFDLLMLNLSKGLTIKVRVMEEDATGIFGVIPGINDYIGEFTFNIEPSGQVKCSEGKDTSRVVGTEDNRYRFVMLGSRAEYITEFELNIR